MDSSNQSRLSAGKPGDSGMRRIFFGLWPSQSTAAEITEWAKDAHALCGGRMMRQENLHLTLAFLGSTPQRQVDELARAATAWVVPARPLSLEHFGRFAGPRVVWAGPTAIPERHPPWLFDLYEQLWEHLGGMGVPRPQNSFRPHVSLLRKAGPGEVEKLRRPPLVWIPERCVLVASNPGEGGSHYEVLAELPLD